MAPLSIDPAARCVTQGDRRVVVGARAFDLLMTLAGEPDRWFSAEALTTAVWPGRVVEDHNLRMQVLALRKALGDASAVLRVAGRGYKLGTPVRWMHAARPTGNVPHWPEPLLGRQAELGALQQLLQEHRLVTLLGPGGVGKTRLAQQLLRDQQSGYPDGVWWVDLVRFQARAQALPALAQAVASALELPSDALRGDAAATQLGRMLVSWHGLLLLDNAEHLVGAEGPVVPLVQELLAAGPSLRVLVTSQHALRLADEWVYRLDPLAVPADGATAAQARDCAALQLLVRRAAAAEHRFELQDDEVATAASVVRHLDGIPLAIEMAAARLPLLGVQTLHDQLAERLQLRLGQPESTLPRHRTLRAALDWSHALLSPSEQAALRQLSVFAGPFRMDSARQLLDLPGLDAGDVLQVIQSLVDKSLLQRQAGGTHGVPVRLRLLESTRAHAAEALQAHGDEAASTQRRHAQAMAELARQAAEDYKVCSDAVWIARWVPDYEDLALGFDHAHQFGDADSAGQIIELLVISSKITGQTDWAVSRWAATRELAPQALPLARARLLGWGNYRPPPGSTRVEAAAARVQAWRELGDIAKVCASLAVLAQACEHAGDRAGADNALRECSALEDPAWPLRLRLNCAWVALGEIAVQRTDPKLLARARRRALMLAPQLELLGAEVELLNVQDTLSMVLCLQDRYDEALDILHGMKQLCLRRRWAFAEGVYRARAVVALVALAEARGGAPELLARACVEAQRALLGMTPGPDLLRTCVDSLALLACRLGDPAHGALLLAAGERLRREVQYAAGPLNERAAVQVRLALQAAADAEDADDIADSAAAGARLDAAALHLVALTWLRSRSQAAPDPKPPGTN